MAILRVECECACVWQLYMLTALRPTSTHALMTASLLVRWQDMFRSAASFNGNLSSWDVGMVTNMGVRSSAAWLRVS